MRFLVPVTRVALAVLTAAALAASAAHAPSVGVGIDDFFSYFTVLSNCATTLVLAYGALAAALGLPPTPDLLRGAVTLYMVITGLVFAIALADVETAMLPWTNTVLHQLMPLVMLADWLLFPPTRPLRLSRTVTWLAFPLLYAAYTLVRGPLAHWYPYPFLNAEAHGYPRVLVACLLIAVLACALTAAITWAANARRRQSAQRTQA
ncbi:Pr6Pr family membrane protein [Streptomyces sp. cg35]|uniref:Pr6Pr family membrane protein n=1 Tax=Streptomyces sp. cg35 TaxID=3421650 RepID=UPI003D17A16F